MRLSPQDKWFIATYADASPAARESTDFLYRMGVQLALGRTTITFTQAAAALKAAGLSHGYRRHVGRLMDPLTGRCLEQGEPELSALFVPESGETTRDWIDREAEQQRCFGHPWS